MEKVHKDALAIAVVVVLAVFVAYLMYDYAHEEEPEFPYNIHWELRNDYTATEHFEVLGSGASSIEGAVAIYESGDGYEGDVFVLMHSESIEDIELWNQTFDVRIDPAFVVTDVETNYEFVYVFPYDETQGNNVRFEPEFGNTILLEGDFFAAIHMIWSGKVEDRDSFTFEAYLPYESQEIVVTPSAE